MAKARRREVLLGAAAGVASLGASAFAAGQRRPNIIFILADDLGVADVSCYGAPEIRTPAVDRIAAEGAKFSQAYANSAVCTASRVALITGRYQYRLPIGLEEPLAGTGKAGLPPSHPTLPSLLKKAGYETALIGKWHLGFLPDYGPLKSGYDHFFGFRAGATDYFSHAYEKPDLWEDDEAVVRDGYLTTLLGDRATAFIKGRGKASAPYFMSLHFSAPHWPWEGPEDQAESKRIGSELNHRDGGSAATYRIMVEAMDAQIGRVLKALADTGQARDTVVVFTSDNGGERFSNTWPFSGKKMDLLEGGLRVPAVVRWPARIKRGLVSGQTMIHMDWVATLLEAAGATPDPAAPLDGISLMPVLTAGVAAKPRTLYWRFKGNAQRAIREGDYKALKVGSNSFLFNVVVDPQERANLKKRQPEVYKRLTGAWDTWNRGMLPEDPATLTGNNTAANWVDRAGAAAVAREAIDDFGPWPD